MATAQVVPVKNAPVEEVEVCKAEAETSVVSSPIEPPPPPPAAVEEEKKEEEGISSEVVVMKKKSNEEDIVETKEVVQENQKELVEEESKMKEEFIRSCKVAPQPTTPQENDDENKEAIAVLAEEEAKCDHKNDA